jgi:pyrimidine-nucleoside phosphorylase
MLNSGETLDLSDIPGTKVDKHSTGGVGDKTSLLLAPMVASCGVAVPMMSGRGLGHTGGTLDKLESIPGFRTQLSAEEFKGILKKLNCAMTGQTEKMVPADRKMYALRDVTATVESIPLISASILSKKIAEGADALVLDVKTGSGAFMPDQARALELARTMIAIGKGMGKRIVALITDMSQPLGFAVGNALEVRESIQGLSGEGPKDLMDLVYALGAEMLVLGGKAGDSEQGKGKLLEAVQSGKALETFRRLVEAQGGDARVVDDQNLLPRASLQLPVPASKEGLIAGMNCLEIGLASVALGAGRLRLEDKIDPGVGLVFQMKAGDRVKAGEPIAIVHANDRGKGEACVQRVAGAVTIADTFRRLPLIVERITS